jgi:hypothetical protein
MNDPHPFFVAEVTRCGRQAALLAEAVGNLRDAAGASLKVSEAGRFLNQPETLFAPS